MQTEALLEILILIMVANGAPILAKRLLGGRLARPLDGGRPFFDGRPIFGHAKTLRGLLVAMLATSATAPLLGLPWSTGLIVGATAMGGDLLASFIKRRLALPPHSQALGLDQIPESLFPLLACRKALGLGALDIGVGVAAFLIGELLLSRLLFRIGIRSRPY